MATPDSANGEPTPACGAVLLQRLDGVRGATRKITTGCREQRSERDLVCPNNENQQRPHESSVAFLPTWPFRAGRKRQSRAHAFHLGAECGEVSRISLVPRAYHHVERVGRRPEPREQLQSCDLSKSPLELIAPHSRHSVLRHDETDPAMGLRGSDYSDVEMRGPKSLPPTNDSLYFCSPRQPMAARKAKIVNTRFRRPRTCSAA